MGHVLVAGAGPAGLAAAEALLSKGTQVTLVSMEPYLGGNASSFYTKDGRTIEQGQHIMVGFYREMRALLERSGVDVEKVTSSNNGHILVYEDRDEGTHHLHLGGGSLSALKGGLTYSGMTFTEKMAFGSFLARAIMEVLPGVSSENDNLCMTAWALKRGLPLSFATTNAFRASREGQFNWPGEISAYSLLNTMKEMARDSSTSEIRFPKGGMSEIWWEPVARRILALGGKIFRGRELINLEHSNGRIAAAITQKVDLAKTDPNDFLHEPIPIVPDSIERWEGFDAYLLAIPVIPTQKVLKSAGLDDQLGLKGIRHLKTVAPMGLHVWHKNAVDGSATQMGKDTPRTLILGLEPPLSIALDNKPFNPFYQNDTRFGAVLHFVGNETGFEHWTDEELMIQSMESIKKVRGYEQMNLEDILAWRLVRDNTPHRRYWLSEPGSLKYKPQSKTSIEGLWLAGDWVRSKADFPCMECAVRSGLSVALEVERSLS